MPPTSHKHDDDDDDVSVNVFGAGPDSGDDPDQPAESPPQSHCSYRQLRVEKFYRSIKSRLIVAEVIKRLVLLLPH